MTVLVATHLVPRLPNARAPQVDGDQSIRSASPASRRDGAAEPGEQLVAFLLEGVGSLEAPEFDKILVATEDEEVRTMTTTMVEWWEKQGLEKGLERGRKEGMQQGEVSLLKRQLRRRFDQLPQWIDRRLEQASREELEGWADRVLDAERLEDVFSSA